MRQRRKMAVSDLQIGMYVCELDRPWLETPFPLQGFFIHSPDDVDYVARFCREVTIDTGPDVPLDVAPRLRTLDPAPSTEKKQTLRIPAGADYRDQVAVEKEAAVAEQVRTRTRQLLHHVLEDVRLGRSVDARQAQAIVDEVVDSIVRNPDALMWLTHLKNRDEYTSIHCINVCIMAVAFGRHIGFPKESLMELGMGALLHDVGKMLVPGKILNKPGPLTKTEFAVIRKHAEHAMKMLSSSPGIPKAVLDIAFQHHERLDGSGYPRKLKGDEISLLSRMVSIVDVYDAITSDRVYHDAESPQEALRWIYQHRDSQFDRELVEQFIQCLGIFPVGSIVEMSTGEIGIVISVNRERRLRPKVMLVRDELKESYEPVRTVDLLTQATDSAGKTYEIRRVLETGAHGVHVKDYLRRGHFGPTSPE